MQELLRDDKPIDPSHVFHKSIVSGLDKSKVILERYDLKRILATYPFSHQLYVSVCPVCTQQADPRHLKPLLERQAIIPVFSYPYDAYDPKFLSIVLAYPHISVHEFVVYRLSVLWDIASGLLCQHCVDQKRGQLLQYIKTKNLTSKVLEQVDVCLSNLFLYMEPDFELIDQMESALKSKRTKELMDIVSMSFAVRDIRTSQAYSARMTIPAQAIPGLLQQASSSPEVDPKDFELVQSALASDLHLEIPRGVDISHYLACLEPYRSELSTMVDEIIDEANTSPLGTMSSLSGKLVEVNEHLIRLSKSKSYLAYKASVAFIRSNKAMIASSLLATALGLSGNALGCGVSLATGLGIGVAKRFGKIRVPEEVDTLVDEVKHTVRPYINKLIAKYLHLDVKAVELWEIRERLSLGPKDKGVLTKSRGTGRTRSG